MRWLELKIPPVIVVFIAVVLMGLTAKYIQNKSLAMISNWQWWVFFGLALLGATIAALGVRAFVDAKTTVKPHRPEESSELVTNGIYQFTRNPMYLGFGCFLLGWVILLGTAVNVVWWIAYIVYLTQFQIKPEERVLAKQFPEHFKQYQSRVRRWI